MRVIQIHSSGQYTAGGSKELASNDLPANPAERPSTDQHRQPV